jgi:hypothetical protein
MNRKRIQKQNKKQTQLEKMVPNVRGLFIHVIYFILIMISHQGLQSWPPLLLEYWHHHRDLERTLQTLLIVNVGSPKSKTESVRRAYFQSVLQLR